MSVVVGPLLLTGIEDIGTSVDDGRQWRHFRWRYRLTSVRLSEQYCRISRGSKRPQSLSRPVEVYRTRPSSTRQWSGCHKAETRPEMDLNVGIRVRFLSPLSDQGRRLRQVASPAPGSPVRPGSECSFGSMDPGHPELEGGATSQHLISVVFAIDMNRSLDAGRGLHSRCRTHLRWGFSRPTC